MAPKTRAVFVQHQRTIRPNATNAEIYGEWNAKTLDQRAQWVDKFNEAVEAKAEAIAGTNGRVPRVFALLTRHADRAWFDRGDKYFLFFDQVSELAADLQPTIGPFQHAQRLWEELHAAEETHAGRSQESLDYNLEQVREMYRQYSIFDGYHDSVVAVGQTPPVGADSQGRRRQPFEWAAPNRLARRKYLAHGRDVESNTLGLPGQWVHMESIDGGMSSGGVWVRYDGNNQIADRVYRKTAFSDDQDWRDPSRFQGPINDPNQKIPNELACHHALHGRPGIVRLKEAQYDPALVDNVTQSYRVYTEWCENGTFEAVVNAHQDQDIPIPEPFIWSVAESLCRAGISMRGEGDEEIVHRDMTPGNCFLRSPHPHDVYPDYPQAVLGDFGLAFGTFLDDPNNLRWYKWCGTMGFLAPEQRYFVYQTTWDYMDESVLGEMTNVYGFGLILWCLIMRDGLPHEPLYLHPAKLDRTLLSLRNEAGNNLGRTYSKTLKKLVGRCLAYDPSKRPAFANILNAIRKRTGGYGEDSDDDDDDDDDNEYPDLSEGMRNGSAKGLRRSVNLPRLAGPRYPVGMVAPQVEEEGEQKGGEEGEEEGGEEEEDEEEEVVEEEEEVDEEEEVNEEEEVDEEEEVEEDEEEGEEEGEEKQEEELEDEDEMSDV
ncbi:uncharacterized protein LTR77_004039 [Saxophila tyrrhenica]|uniref:non-specific serine/threonine protein kinase n=1 Tax=Saxophila tyrrhenica TaxID=1690608 RepID=A0AAV9PCC0_9PEZI|nr:hypothetical protein LTR77_004039 [Saxophila tyrrhenica]